ncbi:MAG: succinate dehydrogenase cytochrome b subunit [Bacteroidales bacterium]|jgi:succinate dehydrogenase / fumarate reductase cytochrome b subunit|nr:succinate dehydrogenase cytochrome b subunit [Bacteroidales bacterium]
MKLLKFASITKKMALAAAGLFLLVFLPVHAGLNLCILRSDGGYWYRVACHFMGTNWIVKVFEVILFATIALHVVIAVILTIENRFARPVRYATPHKTKTHWGSKYMIWTGGLVCCFLILHFINFYFVKMDWVEGKYTANVEKVATHFQNKMVEMQSGKMNEEESSAFMAQFEAVQALAETNMTTNGKDFVNMNREQIYQHFGTDFEDYEPDFYTMANELFKNKIYVTIYLIVFIVMGFHLFHAINSICQTMGFNHKKYNRFIELFALGYAVVIPLMFAVVPLYVMFIK